jgi:hypothetical protein
MSRSNDQIDEVVRNTGNPTGITANMNLRFPYAFLLAAIAVTFNATIGRESTDQVYRYVVSWDAWDDREKEEDGWWGMMDVRLNGEVLGKFQEGFEKLEDLPVRAGERIKLEMPPAPPGKDHRPGHWVSGFIQKWMEKGAITDWYEGGKKFDVRSVTWTDYLRNHEYVRNMDEVTWIVDGKPIGKEKDFLEFIEPWKKKKNLVIQLVMPLKWDPPIEVDPGLTLRSLELLDDGKERHVYYIEKVRPLKPEPAGSSKPLLPGDPPPIPGLDPPKSSTK